MRAATHFAIRIDRIDNVPTSGDVGLYALSGLTEDKSRLNKAKDKLNAYYKTERTNFRQFLSIADTYSPLRGLIKSKFNAKIVTNAWMKYWEIYKTYGLIPSDPTRRFMAFFNAELPGAALCAFNHFMKTERPSLPFDWRASSLAPGDNATKNLAEALGDSYGLYERNREKWLMTMPGTAGRTNNGDVTVMANLEDFAAVVGPDSSIGGVDLYSHDAGIDVSEDFNNQETSNARIHLGCALAGFMTLRPGGSFIAKQYTCFETFTWNLIIIYAQMFDEFYLCKPLTSRPYNSEIYLVGKGFRGLPAATRALLADRLANFNMSPLIPAGAVKVLLGGVCSEIEQFARHVFRRQAERITDNVRLYNQYRTRLQSLRADTNAVRSQQGAAWLESYPVHRISDKDQLASNVG